MKGKETLRIELLLYRLTAKIGTYRCHEVGLFKGKEIVDFFSVSTSKIITCYEIKTSWSDYNSKAAISFYGHRNFYVFSDELYKELIKRKALKSIPNYIGIYVAKDDCLELVKRCILQRPKITVETALFALIKCILREKNKR